MRVSERLPERINIIWARHATAPSFVQSGCNFADSGANRRVAQPVVLVRVCLLDAFIFVLLARLYGHQQRRLRTLIVCEQVRQSALGLKNLVDGPRNAMAFLLVYLNSGATLTLFFFIYFTARKRRTKFRLIELSGRIRILHGT